MSREPLTLGAIEVEVELFLQHARVNLQRWVRGLGMLVLVQTAVILAFPLWTAAGPSRIGKIKIHVDCHAKRLIASSVFSFTTD